MKTGTERLHSSVTPEWYTPSHITEKLHRILGGIDLDPCCSEKASLFTRPSRFYSEGALEKAWGYTTEPSSLYVNAPGGVLKGRSYAGLFWKKLMAELVLGHVKHAVWFAFNLEQLAVSQKYHELKMLMFPFFVPRNKIGFCNADGVETKAGPHSCAFVYVYVYVYVYVPGTVDETERFKTIISEYPGVFR